jgi:hypothetical protein
MKFLSQISVNTRYTLPIVDGTNGQVLSTDGNGVAYWGTISAGSLTLDGLSDVILTSPSSDQMLRYGLRQGDTVPVWHNFTPNFLTPSSSIDSLGDVSITTAAAGQILQYNGSNWVNATLSTVEYVSKVQHAAKAGVAIAKGQAVYVTGANGTNMIIGLASNTSEGTSSKTMGIAASAAAVNDIIFVVTEGLLAGINTSTATAGDPVWLGTSGNLIFGLANKPTSPAHLVYIGVVTRAQLNNGEIFIKVQNGVELDEIHDVQISSPATGQLLRRDSDGYWKNWTPNFLTAEADTLQSVTSRGSSTSTDVSIGGVGGDRGLSIYHGSGVSDYGRIRFYQTSTNINTIHSFSTAWQSGNVLVSGGALNLTGNTGVTIGGWNDPDAVFRAGGGTYFRNSVGIGINNPQAPLDVNGNIYIRETGALYTNTIAGYSTNVVSIGASTNFIVPSGNVGIRTTTPQKFLDVNGSGIVASFGGGFSPGSFAGLHFGYSESYLNSDNYKKSALVFERTDNHGQGANASGKIHFLLNNISSGSATSLAHSVMVIDTNSTATQGSARVGIGTTSPNATLDVNGAANATSFSSTALLIANADTSGSLQPGQGDPANKIYSFRWQGNEGGYIDTDNKITFSGFKTPAGTSSQFLKANGTVDSNTYITSTALNGYATQSWVNTNYYNRDQIDDFFGGAEAISGYNKSNWDAAYNDKINSASFSTTTGVLTLTQQDTGTVTVDIDGRYLESEVDTLATVTARGNVSNTGIRNEGGHYTTLYENVLPSANNGGGAGLVQMAWWVSEPGITWSNGGFGYNVINDGAAPYGFGRRNSSLGQAYMRMSTSGDWFFYNANTSGVRVETMTLTSVGSVGIGRTSPLYKLDVAGNARFDNEIYTSGVWSTTYGPRSAGNHILFQDFSGNTRARIHTGAGVTSVGNRKLSLGILDINSQGTPQIKINTRIPFALSSADFTVNIKGFQYGDSNMVSLSIGWHYYLSQFYNESAISNGSFSPTITLGVEAEGSNAGNVVIHLSNVGYWPKLYVESVHSSAYADDYVANWSWEDASADALTNSTVVPYKSLATSITGNAAYATNSGNSATTSQTNFTTLTLSSNTVATQTWVQSQGYLTSLPAHNHDDRYYTETESDSRFYLATNPSGYISGISFANVSAKPTTVSGYGITDAITTANIGSQSVSYADYTNRTYRGIIEDTRAAQRTPSGYDDYRVSWEFTNQITGIADWHTVMTMQGWHDGYAAWQIIGPSSTTAHENWYLRSGNTTVWNSLRRIWHNGDFTSTNVSNWNTAYGWGDHAEAGYLTNYSYTETDTLSTVTSRGGSTGSPVVMYGKVTLGNNSSGTYSGNTTGLTLNSTAEVRSTGIQNPPALTWHYEGLATRHLLMTSAGAMNFVSPSNEASGVAVLQVNGNTVWHAGNLNIAGFVATSGAEFTGPVIVNVGDVAVDTMAFKVAGPSDYDSLTIGMRGTPDYDSYIASFGNDIHFYSGKGVTTENHSFFWYTSKSGSQQHGVVAMKLDHLQNLTIGGTYTENSSIRYKDNITPLESVSGKVEKLEAVAYTKKGDELVQLGLIAESVSELFPEIVKYDEDGRPDGVSYTRLSVILLKAVQELTERVNKLENK